MAKLAGGQELARESHKSMKPLVHHFAGQGGPCGTNRRCSRRLSTVVMTLARHLIIRAIKSGKRFAYRNITTRSTLKGFGVTGERVISNGGRLPWIMIWISIQYWPMVTSSRYWTRISSLKAYEGDPQERPAIRPYPVRAGRNNTVKRWYCSMLLRPILPEDEPLHADFINRVSVKICISALVMSVNSIMRH